MVVESLEILGGRKLALGGGELLPVGGKLLLDVGKLLLDWGKLLLDVGKLLLDGGKLILDGRKLLLDGGKLVLEVRGVYPILMRVLVLNGGVVWRRDSPVIKLDRPRRKSTLQRDFSLLRIRFKLGNYFNHLLPHPTEGRNPEISQILLHVLSSESTFRIGVTHLH